MFDRTIQRMYSSHHHNGVGGGGGGGGGCGGVSLDDRDSPLPFCNDPWLPSCYEKENYYEKEKSFEVLAR